MSAKLKTEGDLNLKPEDKEWLGKTISEMFDELFVEISTQFELHPSEEINRDVQLLEDYSSKIYDFINSYHGFCKLCEQHFYARSEANDINSFFQKHLNTSYHRQIRKVEHLPKDRSMFTWEEEFHSGRCNLCDMSGLDSFVIDTKNDSFQLMKLHVCVWDKENRETNEKVLRKFNLLKKYCGLKIFREKCIGTVKGVPVCLPCGVKLQWPPEKAFCHLFSEDHYQNFCFFLRKYFGFTLKDILNGFNLELVTRWLISNGPPVAEEFVYFNERELCLLHSNSTENMYPEEESNLSFSPKCVLNSEETNFIHKGECLICNVPIQPEHLSSELHKAKAVNPLETLFSEPWKYAVYCENQQKRLRMINNFKMLKLGLRDPYKPPPSKKKEAERQASSSQVRYFKSFFLSKIKFVNGVFTPYNNNKIFCHVCDLKVPAALVESHLGTSCHKSEVKKWDELKANFADEKFMEPFQKVKNIFICLLCGMDLNPNNFFSHLKGVMHALQFKCYCDLNIDVPISSILLVRPDLSSCCTKCNILLSKRVPLSLLKQSLKTVKLHWPCPKLRENNKGLVNASKADSEESIKPVEKSEDGVQDPDGSTCWKEMDGQPDTIDFKKVEKTMESIVNVFEEKIINNVLDKSPILINRLNNLKLVETKQEPNDGLGQTDKRESSTECDLPSSPIGLPSKDEDEREVERKCKKNIKNGLDQKTKTTFKKMEKDKSTVKKVQNDEEDHEVLLIQGLPSSERKYKVINSLFKSFGKIRYILFDSTVTILAFVEPGVAETLAKNPNLFSRNSKLSMKVTTRKALALEEEKLPTLNKDLVWLLQDPVELVDFLLNLMMQVVTASESPVERRREELVCNTILSAVSKCYPQGRCYPFGSRLSGLVTNNSDLDVFLDCGGMYEGFKNTTLSSEKKLVNKVAGLLRKNREITEMVVVNRARVPIVSFLHKPTLMRCDLSFKNGLSIQNTLLIRFMLSIDWRVRPLILFLKHWARLNGLHGPPYFSSYAIALLVIFYLEQLERPVLPTVESLQNSFEGRRITVAGWDCSINSNLVKLPKLENKDPLPQLLKGLFEFYANYDYNANVISPLCGKPLSRGMFSASRFKELPMCYKRQILNIPLPIENLVDSCIKICLMDPFDLSYILTKSVTSRSLQIFKDFCKTSGQHLSKGLLVVKKQM